MNNERNYIVNSMKDIIEVDGDIRIVVGDKLERPTQMMLDIMDGMEPFKDTELLESFKTFSTREEVSYWYKFCYAKELTKRGYEFKRTDDGSDLIICK